jgi:hypothetical protein
MKRYVKTFRSWSVNENLLTNPISSKEKEIEDIYYLSGNPMTDEEKKNIELVTQDAPDGWGPEAVHPRDGVFLVNILKDLSEYPTSGQAWIWQAMESKGDTRWFITSPAE